MKDYPAANQKERLRIIRMKWLTLPPMEKQQLKDVANGEMRDWWQEMSTVDGAKTKLYLLKTEGRVKRTYSKVKKIKKQLEKHFGKPDKPSTVLVSYYKDIVSYFDGFLNYLLVLLMSTFFC